MQIADHPLQIPFRADFYWCVNSHTNGKLRKKECCIFPFSEKYSQKLISLIKIAKNRHNCFQHERVLKVSLLLYFYNRQFWLHILTNDHYFRNIKELRKIKFRNMSPFNAQFLLGSLTFDATSKN